MNGIVEATDLKYETPGGRCLFEGLGFQLRAGEILSITGPNGSGKSTLLKLITGGMRASHGKVENHVSADRTVVIPQLQNREFHLPLTLGDVLEISVGRRVSELEAGALGLLDPPHLRLAWNTASGGERQRTLLTSALLQSPGLLVLDEPLNHLDRVSQECILTAIRMFLARPHQAGAVILVSHLSFERLQGFGGRVVSVALKGTPEELEA